VLNIQNQDQRDFELDQADEQNFCEFLNSDWIAHKFSFTEDSLQRVRPTKQRIQGNLQNSSYRLVQNDERLAKNQCSVEKHFG
jgi:hypothetical protein